MVVAEVLTGIALVKQSVDFIKSNLDTVNDIKEIGDQIENLFIGEEQVQKARNSKAGVTGMNDQLGIKSVAQEVIDARLAQESMQRMRTMIDMRFGPGTWQSIVDTRARRIREERARLEAIRREKIRKQKEIQEAIVMGTTLVLVASAMIGGFFYLIYAASSS